MPFLPRRARGNAVLDKSVNAGEKTMEMLKRPCCSRRAGRRRFRRRGAAFGALASVLLATPLVGAQSFGKADGIDAGPEDGSVFDEPTQPLRKLGLMFDFGTMDGGMMSLVYRPMPWLRFNAGAGTNFAAPGIRVGTVVNPFRNSGWAVSLDGGHFYPGNVNGVFQAFAGSDYDDSHLLEHFDYNYVNLQVGWEIERNDLMFFARGGVGLLMTQLPQDQLDSVRNLSSLVDPDGSVEALLPSLKVGIIGFL
jgi:hypothetical protein